MKLNLPQEVLENRLQLLRSIDRFQRQIDTSGSMDAVDKFTGQAMNLILGGASDAFDYKKEAPRLVERYDTSHIRIGHKLFRRPRWASKCWLPAGCAKPAVVS